MTAIRMRHVLTLFFLISWLHTFAQKEVYFADTITANQKVQSLHGIEISLNPYKLGYPEGAAFGELFNISGYIGYFNEMSIAKTGVMVFTLGIHNVLYDKIIVIDDYTITWEKDYFVFLHVGIEPRWYYTFNKLYEEGKSRLNSGWFLGLPLSLENPYHVFQLHMTPSLGFRSAFSNHLFLETSAGTGLYLYLNQSPIRPVLDYFVTLKIAYTF
jgi:hypothetical protein